VLRNFDSVETWLTGQARAIVLSSAGRTEEAETTGIEVLPGSELLIVALVDENGVVSEDPGSFNLRIINPRGEELRTADNEVRFVHSVQGRPTLVVDNSPEVGHWSLEVTNPEALNLRITVLTAGPHVSQSSPWATFRCVTCMLSVDALAVTIIFALAKAAIPAAILAAVAKFLGIAVELAENFIHALLGFNVEDIARILCRRIGLCPGRRP
jgi:hypothetical protein